MRFPVCFHCHCNLETAEVHSPGCDACQCAVCWWTGRSGHSASAIVILLETCGGLKVADGGRKKRREMERNVKKCNMAYHDLPFPSLPSSLITSVMILQAVACSEEIVMWEHVFHPTIRTNLKMSGSANASVGVFQYPATWLLLRCQSSFGVLLALQQTIVVICAWGTPCLLLCTAAKSVGFSCTNLCAYPNPTKNIISKPSSKTSNIQGCGPQHGSWLIPIRCSTCSEVREGTATWKSSALNEMPLESLICKWDRPGSVKI